MMTAEITFINNNGCWVYLRTEIGDEPICIGAGSSMELAIDESIRTLKEALAQVQEWEPVNAR